METVDSTTSNEDWTRQVGWDVTDASGAPVTDLAVLADVLGTDEVGAARELLASPAVVAAPPELVAAAQAAADTSQQSLFAEDGDAPPPDTPAPAEQPPAEETPPAEEKPAEGAPPTDDEEEEPMDGTKAFPWQKDKKPGDKGPDTGASTRKVTIAAGAFVSWSGGRGKVEAVVVNGGKVPGVDSDITGTESDPAAKVRVWKETDGSWKATDERVAAKTSSLKTIPPLDKQGKSGSAGLVALIAEYDGVLADVDRPSTKSVQTVYERGRRSWPGPSITEVKREDWALGRARAFLEKAGGSDLDGYVGDDDLLPG